MLNITEAILKRNTSTLNDPFEKCKLCLDKPEYLEKVEVITPPGGEPTVALYFKSYTFKYWNVITIDFDKWEDMGLSKSFMIMGGEDNYYRQMIQPLSKRNFIEGYTIYADHNLHICLPKGGFQLRKCTFKGTVCVVPEFEDSDNFLVVGVIDEDTKEVVKKWDLKKSPVDIYTPNPKSNVKFTFGVKFKITEENYRLNGKFLGKLVDWMEADYKMMYAGTQKTHMYGKSEYDIKNYKYTYDLYDLT